MWLRRPATKLKNTPPDDEVHFPGAQRAFVDVLVKTGQYVSHVNFNLEILHTYEMNINL